ncbi:hypothetical protein AAFN60_09515 [Roseibacillus persicicus]|uniref:hypothetical protein n=1 Tax=Roseibacillus persicicus TaxID=454148 RepID=UPI00398B7E7F
MNRRTSRALALFPLLLFALQTFLPAFSSCPGYASDKDGNRLSRTSSNILLRTLLPNQSQSYNANGNTTQSPSPLNNIDYAEGSSVDDVYDFRNKLIRRTLPDRSTIDLEYNADALLIAKSQITNNPITPSTTSKTPTTTPATPKSWKNSATVPSTPSTSPATTSSTRPKI